MAIIFDLEPIFEFSRNNCVTICSFLIPANLLATLLTFILAITGQSLSKIGLAVVIATSFTFTLFLHVSTWFIIGVITPVTFILFGLGAACLLTNILLLIYRQQLAQWRTLLDQLKIFKRA
ncbi:MAG: hypothetical protein ACFCU5_05500 [Pleurocapsa sp.]